MKESEKLDEIDRHKLAALQNENFYLKSCLEEAIEILKFYQERRNYIPVENNLDDLCVITSKKVNLKWLQTSVMKDWGKMAREFLKENRKWFVRHNIKH